MVIKVNGQDIEVTFQYAGPLYTLPKEKRGRLVIEAVYADDRTTHCMLTIGDETVYGIAVKNPKDKHVNFTRAAGRKVAFADALNQAGIDREQRKEYWKALFEKVNMK